MSKKSPYIKCPRCELNYIDKKQKLCNVCRAELKMPNSFYSDSDDSDDTLLELCPLCKTNFVSFDEDMCDKCKRNKENGIEIVPSPEDEDEEDWKTFLDDDGDVPIAEEGTEILLSQIEEEEFDENEQDDEEEFFVGDSPDNFDAALNEIDELTGLSDDDDDDDDEDDEDESDDDDDDF